ncbi:SGNH/GDSL hydrolase family protein [Arthrobacter cheniae]|uniref:SGNH/GDSL hydrolase family protein n=1 Tax=Arthrobacter cheniae TaxID=1258888 RepID=A0A3A5MAP6_9MICC|nr:SGNH/GDSL hydrolase family protein [Arthrobacter cheniae]RJT79146.1 SGNH/GDSL hydrolase family protein [Arthrobacter cheniae]
MNSRTTGPSGVRDSVRKRTSRAAVMALGLNLAVVAGFVPPAAANPPDRPSVISAEAPRAVPLLTPPGVSLPAGPESRATAPRTTGTTTVNAPVTPPVVRPQVGSFAKNPATGRREIVVPDVRRTAVLIGDSQAAGPDTWPQIALRQLGYTVSFAGAGGTGFVANSQHNGAANYYDAFTSNAWVLPHGDPALVVVQGGGNDAANGASDGDILASANALLLGLERTYPTSRLVLIGTLSRSPRDGGGRRAEVDALLRDFATSRGITFVSPGDWLTTHKLKGFLADEVHLTSTGAQKAAVVLEQNLAALKLGAPAVLSNPSQWPRWERPLE